MLGIFLSVWLDDRRHTWGNDLVLVVCLIPQTSFFAPSSSWSSWDCVALYVRAMSIALSKAKSSPFSSSLSWIFLCFVPSISCSIRRSSASVKSLNLHFVVWLPQHVMKSLIASSLFCRSCCSWYRARLCFTFGATCFSNRSHNFAGFVLPSSFYHVQLLYMSRSCLPIHSNMNEACSFSVFLENAWSKIRLQSCLNFMNSSRGCPPLPCEAVCWPVSLRLLPSCSPAGVQGCCDRLRSPTPRQIAWICQMWTVGHCPWQCCPGFRILRSGPSSFRLKSKPFHLRGSYSLWS